MAWLAFRVSSIVAVTREVDDGDSIAARTCCTREVRVGTFTSSSASLEELRACQCSCHRRRTFVFSLLVSISETEKSKLAGEISERFAPKPILCCPRSSAYKSQRHTWNEHNKLSSTLIIAPALSNSPQ